MKKFLALCLFSLIFCGCANVAKAGMIRNAMCVLDQVLAVPLPEDKKDTMFQISTYDAYKQGFFATEETKTSVNKKYGNFGIGLLKDNKGAIIFNNDDIYKINDFEVYKLFKKEYPVVSFGMFKYFETDDKITIKKVKTFDELVSALDKKIETPNYFIAIMAKGKFNSVTIQNQKGETQKLENTTGNLIGVRVPELYNNLAPANYTFYYIENFDTPEIQDNTTDTNAINYIETEALAPAGKVQDIDTDIATFSVDYTNRIELLLPRNKSFKVKDFAQYQPIDKNATTKVEHAKQQKDMESIMKRPIHEPTTEEMLQNLVPKMPI